MQAAAAEGDGQGPPAIEAPITEEEEEEETEDAEAPGAGRPLFPSTPHKDWGRRRAELEQIFTRIFPRWGPTSYRTKVLPLVFVGESTVYG
jgi:hypothetical protein